LTQITALKIRLFGDPVLRKKAHPVKEVAEAHRQALSQMARLMYADSGIGLAGPQAGFSEAMIVADAGSGLYKLVNPHIVKKEGVQALEEGCLSLPGICLKVKRAGKVTVKALDENSRPVSIEAEGLLACVLQHEIDHLKGKLIIDYASIFGKMKIKRKLAAIKKRAKDEKLCQSETKSCQLQL
jgi:peptide deformylase